MNKILMLFLVLLISIVSVSCVSAADMNNEGTDFSGYEESLDVDDSVSEDLISQNADYEKPKMELPKDYDIKSAEINDDDTDSDSFISDDEDVNDSTSSDTGNVEIVEDSKSMIPTRLYAEDKSAYLIDDDFLVITLRDCDGNPLSDLPLYVQLEGDAYYTTDVNGQAKVPIKELGSGIHFAAITF